jgi:hypothetical protein
VFAVIPIPSGVLEYFSSDSIFLYFKYRNYLDYEFLADANPEFLHIYVGGVLIQFIVSTIAAVYMLYVYLSCPGKVYAQDKVLYYVITYTFSALLFGGGAYYFSNVNDFGSEYFGVVSWFADNKSNYSRFMPVPANNVAFLFTGIGFYFYYMLLSVIFSFLALFTFGKPMALSELRSTWRR